MAVLQDVACTLCGSVTTDISLGMGKNTERLRCDACQRWTVHAVVPLGGTRNHRYRSDDLPPGHDPWWEGRVETHGADIHVGGVDGEPVKRLDGSEIVLDQDKSASRRDKLTYQRKKKHGQLPVRVFGESK